MAVGLEDTREDAGKDQLVIGARSGAVQLLTYVARQDREHSATADGVSVDLHRPHRPLQEHLQDADVALQHSMRENRGCVSPRGQACVEHVVPQCSPDDCPRSSIIQCGQAAQGRPSRSWVQPDLDMTHRIVIGHQQVRARVEDGEFTFASTGTERHMRALPQHQLGIVVVERSEPQIQVARRNIRAV